MRHSIKALIAVCALTLLVGGTSLVASADNASTTETITSNTKSTTKSKKPNSRKNVHVDVFSVAASVLGKTTDEVKAAVNDDGKIGDLLITADKVDAFKSAYLTELKAKLDAAVAAETLTQIQADEKYAAGKAKMDTYDGTTHLCGGTDSHMFRNRNSTKPAGKTDRTV